MNHFSLFTGSGIGDYAAEQCGFKTVAQCENDPACLFCLSRMFPNAKRFSDIKSITDDDVRRLGRIDLISGGFPCQDISSAGRGAGLDGDRSSLWFEMLRIINAARPAWLLIENVPALRVRGADRVLAGLEESGYTCWACVVGAWAVGAPHKRDRVWIVAYTEEVGRAGQGDDERGYADESGCGEAMGHAASIRCERFSAVARSISEESEKGWLPKPADGSTKLADAHKTRREKRVCIGSNNGAKLTTAIGSHWPARPGEQQHEWEHPRLLAFSNIWARHGFGDKRHEGNQCGDGHAGAEKELSRESQCGVGNAIDGLAERVHSKANKQLLRMAGNGWCYPVALMFFQWIAEQIKNER